MYNPQISRREFLRGTAGTAGAVQADSLYNKAIAAAGAVGGLVGIVGLTSDAMAQGHEFKGINALREYVQKLDREHKEGQNVVFFRDARDGKEIKARFARYASRPLSLQIILEPERQTTDLAVGITYTDEGIKGFLGRNDSVGFIKEVGEKEWESGAWYLNGGYQIIRLKQVQNYENCSRITRDVCMEGSEAQFKAYAKNPKPQLKGYYSKHATHAQLLERRRREIQVADAQYKRIVREIISKLEREGKIKIG